MKSERNITRLDYARTRGWWVRHTRSDRAGVKRVISKVFSDSLHGGKRKALAAARKWRDAQARKLRKPLKAGGAAVAAGHGYVKRADLKRRVGVHPVYVAWIRIDGGRNRQTTRSVRLWGERGAKRACEQWLRAQRAAIRALGKRA